MYNLSKYSFLRQVAAQSPTFSLVGFGANRSNTINMPAGIQAGDMAIHFSGAGGGVPPGVNWGIPSGYTGPSTANTYMDLAGSADYRHVGSYKILAGNETTVAGIQHQNTKQHISVWRKSPATASWLTPQFTCVVQNYPGFDALEVANTTIEISSQPSIMITTWHNGGTPNTTWNPVSFTPTQTGLLSNTNSGASVDLNGAYIIQNTSQANVYVAGDGINPDSGTPAFPYSRITVILGAI